MSARHLSAAARTLGEMSEHLWKTQAKMAERGTQGNLSVSEG